MNLALRLELGYHPDSVTSSRHHVTASSACFDGMRRHRRVFQQPIDNRMSKDKSDKKNTSLRLDSKTLKALKIRAIEDDTSVQAILELLVQEYLEKNIKLRKPKK